jgi:phosphatidylserine/phosphatidylglycerophosphate/cardiolipin synthase-like enzyme
MKPSDLVKGLVVVATTGALVYGGGAQAAGTAQEKDNGAPDKPTMFVDNDPNGSESEQYRIRNYLVNLIKGAEDNSDITIASYRFNDKEVSDALVDKINNHHVKVRVLADAKDAGKEPYTDVLEATQGKASWIRNCGDRDDSGGNKHTSCIGDHIMHNKFYLFSKTGGKSNVVMHTSSNLSTKSRADVTSSGPEMWNTAYTAIEEKWLYGMYQNYFKDLSARLDVEDYYEYFNKKYGQSNGKYKLYVSPRKKSNSNITFANILKSVECRGNTSGGTPGTGPDAHRTIVRVAAAQIAKGGGAAVAAELWRLDNEGCYVDVVGTDVSQAEEGPLRGGLLRAPKGKYHGPEVREFSTNQCGTHEKNILIDGHYAGKKNQKVVFTGSHNLNRKSPWHNDDMILRIIDPDVHEEFKKHFFKIRDAAAITWQTSKYETYDPDDLEFKCPQKK